VYSCTEDVSTDLPDDNVECTISISDIPETEYSISGRFIIHNDAPVVLNGVNSLQSFGLSDPELLRSWNVTILREFIGNMREQPLDYEVIQAADGSWLHGLQKIVDQNRAHGFVTILCPFGWVDTAGNRTLFTGLHPSDQSFYDAFIGRMQAIAHQFKDQQDVWIEVWNEPYRWNNRGYTHEIWNQDMRCMISALRAVDGFHNIIIIPGNEQGQGDEVLREHAPALLAEHYNILFDLHAYEKWLDQTTQAEIAERITKLKALDIPFIFGEVGAQNVSEVMQTDHFLRAVYEGGIPTLGWVWKLDGSDKNALLNESGLPNDQNNNEWGSNFKSFLSR